MSTLANIIWILTYSLISIGLAMLLYPLYIKLLRKLKAGKTIRENNATGEKSEIFAKLHSHKAGTPTMGWGLFMVIMLIMIWLSFILQKKGIITYSLRNSKETYIILFGFFSMWLIGLVDDWLNIKNFWKIKWLSAKAKMTGMILFSAFISYWFYVKLGIDYINLRPLGWKIEIWIFFPILTFFTTIGIVNAINITDGLDGLAGGLIIIVLWCLGISTFLNGTYIATTIISILISVLVAFLFYNINPAKVFMGDSWAFALGGIVASLLYLLNMRFWIIIPFIIIFWVFILEFLSSGLQIFWKKILKRKLFAVAPFHHLLEYKGMQESTIVMKIWLIQAILGIIWIIFILVQYLTLKHPIIYIS